MRPPLFNSRRLDSPIKRVGYSALIVGVFVAIASLGLFFVFEFRPGIWTSTLCGLFFGCPSQFWRDWNDYYETSYRRICYGRVSLSLVGWFLSYGYEATIARFITWVRTGST